MNAIVARKLIVERSKTKVSFSLESSFNMLRDNLSKLFRGAKPFRQTQQQLTILTSIYKNDWAFEEACLKKTS